MLKKSILQIPLIIALAVGIVVFVLWKSVEEPLKNTKIVGFQDYATPLEKHPDQSLDPRFIMPSAWDAARIPKVTHVSKPAGTRDGAFTYNAQKFWEINSRRGGHHSGDDINGIGGMNSDLGDPVYAIANGLVVYAGEPSKSWGNIVIIAHKKADGTPYRSMYAHLDQINVRVDELIALGSAIGTVGTANNHYPAHLHFEISETETIPLGRGYLEKPLSRVSPSEFIDQYPLNFSSTLGIALSQLKHDWTSINVSGAEKMLQLKSQK